MSDLIRWEAAGPAGYLGFVGTFGPAAFHVIPPGRAVGERWLLSVRMLEGCTFRYGGTEDEVKQQAETWLREFVSSLGAVFPRENGEQR